MNVLRHSSRMLCTSISLVFLFATLSIVSWPHFAVASTPAPGIIIPLYITPGTAWQSVIAEKQSYPSVPIVAVINPDNGPGSSQDSSYVRGINSLRVGGVIPIGYVYTKYGQRSISAVEGDIHTYFEWYNVSGIFFDEMSNVAGYANYYLTLSTYANSLGLALTVGNPGTTVPASYIGTMDVLNVYENQGLPSIGSLGSMTRIGNRSDFAMIAYGVPSINQTYESSATRYVSWIYLTDANQPNPYDVLPSYFGGEVDYLSNIGAASTQTTQTTTYAHTSSTTSDMSTNTTTSSIIVNSTTSSIDSTSSADLTPNTNTVSYSNSTSSHNTQISSVGLDQLTLKGMEYGASTSTMVLILGSIVIFSSFKQRNRIKAK